MSSSQSLYQVVITNGGGGGAPADGFIDWKRIEDYGVSLATTPASLTVALSKAKRRANYRYRDMILQMSAMTNCYIADNTLANDATYHQEGTTLSFMVIIEHGDDSLLTEDENSPGTFLTGIDALTRCVARCMVNTRVVEADFVDPTSADSIGILGASTSVPRYGVRIWPGGTSGSTFEVGAYAANLPTAEGYIAVTKFSFP